MATVCNEIFSGDHKYEFGFSIQRFGHHLCLYHHRLMSITDSKILSLKNVSWHSNNFQTPNEKLQGVGG
jgi:hypothetical protein